MLLTVEPKDAGVRIDVFLAQNTELTRSAAQKLLASDDEAVSVNGMRVPKNYKVAADDVIELELPPPIPLEVTAENIPLDIVYEDGDVILVNKPKGMVVHPAPGNYTGTLVSALLYHCGDSLSGINGVIRPGIVHRIDRDTSGVLVIAKNDNAHVSLAEQIKEHSVNRRYRGIVYGVVKEDEGTIDAPIGRHPIDRKKMAINEKNGKNAVTHYKVLERFERYTYMEFKLETGRTHQIRVHMASIGHPLLGDILYSNGKSPYKLQGQTLHAMTIGFVHPKSKEYIEVTAALPEYFEKILRDQR